MSQRVFGCIIMCLLCVSSASACDWVRVHNDLRFCLDGRNKAKGRDEICLNLSRGSSQYIGGVENGFRNCQRDNGDQANFKSCKETNQDQLYRDGRSMVDLCKVGLNGERTGGPI